MEGEGGKPAATPPAITETPEYKQAVKEAREKLEASIRASNQEHLSRREQEIRDEVRKELTPHQPEPNANGASGDFFNKWGEKHDLSPEAGRDLAQGILGYVETTYVAPLSQHAKRQELRAQRIEVRQGNPRLKELDEKYHAEVDKMLKEVAPHQVKADTYAWALKMVIGDHLDEVTGAGKPADAEGGTKPPAEPAAEPAVNNKPGPQPTGSGAPATPKITLTATQQRWADERSLSPADFVAMVKRRAQKLINQGVSKAEVRGRIGPELLGDIEL